jgi:hypothetical protein
VRVNACAHAYVRVHRGPTTSPNHLPRPQLDNVLLKTDPSRGNGLTCKVRTPAYPSALPAAPAPGAACGRGPAAGRARAARKRARAARGP